MSKKHNYAKALREKTKLIESIRHQIDLNNHDPQFEAVDILESNLEEFFQELQEKFLGQWETLEYKIEETPFLENFENSKLKNNSLVNGSYSLNYDFKENIAIKRLKVTGQLVVEGDELNYLYQANLAFSFSVVEENQIEANVLYGFLYQLIGDTNHTIKEIKPSETTQIIFFNFDGDELILEEKDVTDRKRLRKMSE